MAEKKRKSRLNTLSVFREHNSVAIRMNSSGVLRKLILYRGIRSTSTAAACWRTASGREWRCNLGESVRALDLLQAVDYLEAPLLHFWDLEAVF